MEQKPQIVIAGDLGIRLDSLTPDQRSELEQALTATSRPYRQDDLPVTVCCYTESDGYFWIPRSFALDRGFIPDQDKRVSGLPQDFEFKAKLDPARGQVEAVPAMVKYIRKNGSGLLVAPTGTGKSLLSY